jgi:hypothetical protein
MRLVLSIIVVIFLTFSFGCSNETDIKIGEYNLIIEKIEDFHLLNNRVPTEQEFYEIISKLGYQKSEECPCYQIKSENEYELWFGLELGGSMIYKSKIKKWSEEG